MSYADSLSQQSLYPGLLLPPCSLSWWTSPPSTQGLPGPAGPGSGFSPHSAQLCTLCLTSTEIFSSHSMSSCFIVLPLLTLGLQLRIPPLSCPPAFLSGVQVKQRLPLQRISCHPSVLTPTLCPQVELRTSLVSVVQHLVLLLAYLQHLMYIL